MNNREQKFDIERERKTLPDGMIECMRCKQPTAILVGDRQVCVACYKEMQEVNKLRNFSMKLGLKE